MNGSTLTVGVVPNKDRNVKFLTMFSACITYFGVRTLTPVDGNINSEKNISILHENGARTHDLPHLILNLILNIAGTL
jgi:hypothetical protein